MTQKIIITVQRKVDIISESHILKEILFSSMIFHVISKK